VKSDRGSEQYFGRYGSNTPYMDMGRLGVVGGLLGDICGITMRVWARILLSDDKCRMKVSWVGCGLALTESTAGG
jgi:hypothetical protein